MKKKITYIFISFIFLLLFFYFSIIVKSKALNPFDFDSTVRIQDHVSKSFDIFLSIFSLLGSFEILIIVLGIILLFHHKLKSFIIVPIFLMVHAFEIFGKAFLRHPGPPFMFFRYNIPFFFPSSYVKTGGSYPSGHSLRIVFITTILFFLVQNAKKIKPINKLILNSLIIFFTFLMLLTRVSLGEHWSTDVIGGVFLGAASGLISLIFL